MSIKIGDRIRVGSWHLPVIIDRIYFVDNDDNEVPEELAARIMLEVNWGEHGKSKVSMADEGRRWFKYQDLN